MKKLFRGGAILLLLSLFVVFIYAQAKTDPTLAIGPDPQAKIENNNNTLSNNQQTDDNKKLIKTTASVKAVTAGASRIGVLLYRQNCYWPRCTSRPDRRRSESFKARFQDLYQCRPVERNISRRRHRRSNQRQENRHMGSGLFGSKKVWTQNRSDLFSSIVNTAI